MSANLGSGTQAAAEHPHLVGVEQAFVDDNGRIPQKRAHGSGHRDERAEGDPRGETAPRDDERATLYYARGNMSVALEELRIAVDADPSYATAHGVFGLVYKELRENALAEKSFERALGYAPGDPDINHNYGWFLCQIGREGEAKPYFQRALDNPLYATPGRTYAAAGVCALRAGELAAAEDNLQRALRIEPNLPVALLSFAQLRYSQQRHAEARRLLTQHAAVAQASAESLWLALRVERRRWQPPGRGAL
jgi:type IV pilus assembly protein PilF